MSARAASLYHPDDPIFSVSGTTEFKVKKPASNSSREIRDAILRAYFGYTDADIAALTREKDRLFYIRHKKETVGLRPHR